MLAEGYGPLVHATQVGLDHLEESGDLLVTEAVSGIEPDPTPIDRREAAAAIGIVAVVIGVAAAGVFPIVIAALAQVIGHVEGVGEPPPARDVVGVDVCVEDASDRQSRFFGRALVSFDLSRRVDDGGLAGRLRPDYVTQTPFPQPLELANDEVVVRGVDRDRRVLVLREISRVVGGDAGALAPVSRKENGLEHSNRVRPADSSKLVPSEADLPTTCSPPSATPTRIAVDRRQE